MRTVLAILMLTTMIQVAQADDDDQGRSSGTATGCITSTEGVVTCL